MGRQPVDRGWAWMICLGTGVQSFFVIGGLKSMGVLFVEIIEMFDAPYSLTSLTLGFLAGGFAIFAMLVNVLTVMFGIRPVVMFGAAMFTLSIFMSMFPVHVWYLIMTMGMLMGIALAAMYTPSVLLLNHYFEKRKSFANGVSFVGSSIGQLCLPYLITYLVDEYGYRGAMLIYTAISLHSFAASLLMRPVSFWGKDRVKPREVELQTVQGSDHVPTVTVDADDVADVKNCDVTEDRDNETLIVDRSRSSHHGSQYSVNSRHRDPEISMAVNGVQHDLLSEPTVRSRSNTLTLRPGLSVESLAIIEQPEEDNNTKAPPPRAKKKFLCLKIRTVTCSQFGKLLFDPDLIKSPSLWIIFIALGVGHAGFINALLHLPVLAVEIFDDKYKGAMLIAIAGVFDICGRLGGGWFADLGYITRSNLSAVAFAITGSATVIVTFYPVLWMLILFSLVMGLVGGIYRILLPVIVGDVFGKAKLGPGIGMLFMALGVVAVPIPSLLGYMRNVYLTYIPAFQLCGSLLLFGSALLFTLPLASKCDPAVVKQPKKQISEPQVDV